MSGFLKFLLRAIGSVLLFVVIVLAGFRGFAWWQESGTAARLHPSNGQFVETALGRMHVSVWGEEDATPVMMTHGMAAWGGLWEETALQLARNGYRVIATDQPPFGFSDRSDQNFARSRQALRLGALADAMNLERYILVGHSYGGGVAMETALRFPDSISALVLICPVMNLRPVADQSRAGSSEVPLPLRSRLLAEVLVSASITNPLLTGFLTKRFMHRKDALTARHVEILQRPMTLKGNTGNMVVWLRQFLAGDPDAMSRNRKTLRGTGVPVSLIWGEQDQVTPIVQGEELAEILKPLEFVRLPDIGHMPQLEDPETFNAALLKVFDGLRSANNASESDG